MKILRKRKKNFLPHELLLYDVPHCALFFSCQRTGQHDFHLGMLILIQNFIASFKVCTFCKF